MTTGDCGEKLRTYIREHEFRFQQTTEHMEDKRSGVYNSSRNWNGIRTLTDSSFCGLPGPNRHSLVHGWRTNEEQKRYRPRLLFQRSLKMRWTYSVHSQASRPSWIQKHDDGTPAKHWITRNIWGKYGGQLWWYAIHRTTVSIVQIGYGILVAVQPRTVASWASKHGKTAPETGR